MDMAFIAGRNTIENGSKTHFAVIWNNHRLEQFQFFNEAYDYMIKFNKGEII